MTKLIETDDGRYLIELTGVMRFRIEEELHVATAYRQCRINVTPFLDDFIARNGEKTVNRQALLATYFGAFLKANDLETEWEGIEKAPDEVLVNALSMMAPFGTAEKQALLEAPDLKNRAEILIAITEIELAKKDTGSDTQLQ